MTPPIFNLSLNFGFGAASLTARPAALELTLSDRRGRGGGLAALFTGLEGLVIGAGLDLAELLVEAECLSECAAFTGGVPAARGGFGDGFGVRD